MQTIRELANPTPVKVQLVSEATIIMTMVAIMETKKSPNIMWKQRMLPPPTMDRQSP